MDYRFIDILLLTRDYTISYDIWSIADCSFYNLIRGNPY